jgi:phosphoglycolate phosphatase
MDPIKGVIFDLDGTLLDTLDDLADSMNAVLEGAGLEAHPVGDYKQFIGDGVAKLVSRALPAAMRDDESVARHLVAYHAEYGRRWHL